MVKVDAKRNQIWHLMPCFDLLKDVWKENFQMMELKNGDLYTMEENKQFTMVDGCRETQWFVDERMRSAPFATPTLAFVAPWYLVLLTSLQ